MSNTVFHPPYLRLDIPDDMAKIKKILSDARKPFTFTAPLATQTNIINAKNFRTLGLEAEVKIDPVVPAAIPIAAQFNFQAIGIQAAERINRVAGVQKTGGIPVTVNPSGTVSLGFNCTQSFNIKHNFPNAQLYSWYINFKGANGLFSFMPQYLGYSYGPDASFTMDYSSYYLAAYLGKGTAVFVIECEITVGGVTYPPERSVEITLNFNAPACTGIHHLELSTDTVEGGNNGKEPYMTVYLNGPAGPGGQVVSIYTESGLGWVNPPGTLLIPQGQNSASISWFLATRRVYSTGQHFDILVKANGTIGHARMYLTKKKK